MQNDDPEISRRYVRWHRVKTGLEKYGRQTKVKEGEIYWTSVGQNIGAEIYGKNGQFTRPVLVYKKWGDNLFMAIPLTSKRKSGSWYVSFMHHGRLQTAVLCQVKTMSVKRLYGRIGEIDSGDFRRIRKALRDLL